MTFDENIKTIDSKIEQKKLKMIQINKLLRFKLYHQSFPLGSDLKKQTGATRKEYQGLDKVYKLDKKNSFRRLTDKDRNLTDRDLI